MKEGRHGARARLEWWVPGAYAAVAAAWIYGSDGIVAALAGSIEQVRILSTWKGLGFVAVTTALLHAGLRWALRRERAAADSLRRSEALLRAVTDAIPDPVFLKGLDGRWIFSNPATLTVIGRTMERVIGRTDAEIYDDPSVGSALMETDRRIMTTGVAEVVEERILTPGGYRTFLSTKAPWRDGAGRVVGLIGNARDITDRKQAERDLLAAEERVQQAQRLESVGRLAGGIAHDFNNLLTVIIAASEALQEDLGAGDAPRTEDVVHIRAAAERARDLTARLLAFARKQVSSPVPLDLNEVVRSAAPLLARLLGEGIDLRLALDGGIPAVLCDPAQAEQVLLNLAVNARDAMPRGGTLTVETQRLAGAGGRQEVLLRVRDTGSGMAPEVKARAFEPFFTTKPNGQGTGLGLATVYGIVSQAGGAIRVESEPGAGATFDVSLPAVEGSPASPPVRVAPRERGGDETILLVEDDPRVRDVTARVLGGGGYRVIEAAGGVEALALVERLGRPPDLAITDVVMPGMDGRALADELVRRHPDVPILFLSGYAHDVIGRRGVLDPGIALLPKPYTPAALLARVRAILDQARPEPGV